MDKSDRIELEINEYIEKMEQMCSKFQAENNEREPGKGSKDKNEFLLATYLDIKKLPNPRDIFRAVISNG